MGVKDTNDPSGKIYNNDNGQGSVGVDGDGQRVAGTRISEKELKKYGDVVKNDITQTWSFTGTTINPDTGKAYTLTEVLTKQGGLTGAPE